MSPRSVSLREVLGTRCESLLDLVEDLPCGRSDLVFEDDLLEPVYDFTVIEEEMDE